MASKGPSIHRVTLFKVPDPANQKKLVKPYILHCHAGQAKEDPRSKGYTVVAYTVFASLDDMKYYDTDCAAHAKLKKVAVEIVEEFPLVVYREVEGGLPN
ncbi:uncharacterized protein CTHT_0014070 [Thermochaetoides thermophila DSM 1495]|uniref:Stress-response A/B barrel domain-containing protein n=1 Tax=Chaetomium thermophilum (strain DSM 1495 / CBS 144.50 / IMI 039719) TaxID=759272 RepID=G0S1L9_CHATD|nr:hypothetical protein CTHT_0014070 [Thermochaetoides thermophila DSM 1495]EGS22929.1 hypothetical protein CTHT_0014070 [Thermochaetoides thermophila DSM 1495]